MEPQKIGDFYCYSDIEDAKPDYFHVKVWSVVQFYRLVGKKTVIAINNFEPIPELKYALYSPAEQKYYVKDFSDVPLGYMLYYETQEGWDSYDAFMNSFRRWLADGNLHLLLTQEQVEATTNMLYKMWKSELSGEGKLGYKAYIGIVEESLAYEKYKSEGKSLTGFKTACSMFEDRIANLWKMAYKN